MPLKQCTNDGKSGWKWGDSGHCYTGPNGKKQAIRQGVAVEGPDKFRNIMQSEGNARQDVEIMLAQALREEYDQRTTSSSTKTLVDM